MKKNKINIKYYLKIIDQIEKARKKNNFNWMNVLRVSLKNAPVETLRIMRKINDSDKKILELNKKFHIKKN
jgi:hypothetical protein